MPRPWKYDRTQIMLPTSSSGALDERTLRIFQNADGKYSRLMMICPCGCEDLIGLRLRDAHPDHHPSWEITITPGGLVTLNPSIRDLHTCKAHFWIRANTVVWC